MKLKNLAPGLILMDIPAVNPAIENSESNQVSYIIGGVIALFILGYLLYSLLKPDKF